MLPIPLAHTHTNTHTNTHFACPASLSPAFVQDFEAAWRDVHAAAGRRQLYQLMLRTVSAKGQVRYSNM